MATAERCLAMQATGGDTYMTTTLGAGEPWDLANSCNVFPSLAITKTAPRRARSGCSSGPASAHHRVCS